MPRGPGQSDADEWYNTGMDGHREESWEDEEIMDDPWDSQGGGGGDGDGWGGFFSDQ
jgi:hypothetical protein